MSENKIVETLKKYKSGKEEEAKEMQVKIDIIEKYTGRKPPYTKEEAQEILSLCCYNNISYCCGLQKGCVWRDTVLNIFAISPDDYVSAKTNCQKEMMVKKIK